MGVKAKEFAGFLGVTPQYVTKLGQAGRLVRDADGTINVEASRQRIEETGGTRPDVAERHREGRAKKKQVGSAVALAAPSVGDLQQRFQARQEQQAQAAGIGGDLAGMSLQGARAVKEKYGALRAKAEYETLIGNLLAREEAETAMRFIGGAVRAALDVFPDQTAPLVAPVADLDEIHELLTQACRDALHNIETTIRRQQDELGKAAG